MQANSRSPMHGIETPTKPPKTYRPVYWVSLLALSLGLSSLGCEKNNETGAGKTGGAKSGGAKTGGSATGGNTAGTLGTGGTSTGGNAAGALSTGGDKTSSTSAGGSGAGGVTSTGGAPSTGGTASGGTAGNSADASVAIDSNTGTGGAGPGDGGMPAGLIAYWPLDEANPDDVCVDKSGNGHNATPEASPPRGEGKFGLHGLTMNPTVSAIDPTHDQFVGCTQKVNVATTMPVPSAPFSISVWIRPKMILARQYIVAYTGETEMALFVEKTGELRYWRWDPKPPGQVKHPSEGVFSKSLTAGAWNHIVITIGPSVAVGSAEANHRMYVNGQLTGSYAGGAGTFATGTWHIGAKGSLQFCFSGDIDEVMVFGQVLTPTEVTNLFTSNTL